MKLKMLDDRGRRMRMQCCVQLSNPAFLFLSLSPLSIQSANSLFQFQSLQIGKNQSINNQSINQSISSPPKSLNYITPLPISMPSLPFAFGLLLALYNRCWQLYRVQNKFLVASPMSVKMETQVGVCDKSNSKLRRIVRVVDG